MLGGVQVSNERKNFWGLGTRARQAGCCDRVSVHMGPLSARDVNRRHDILRSNSAVRVLGFYRLNREFGFRQARYCLKSEPDRSMMSEPGNQFPIAFASFRLSLVRVVAHSLRPTVCH